MVAGLSDALAVIPMRVDWVRLEWLLVPDDAMDGSFPLEDLRVGRVEKVNLYRSGARSRVIGAS